MGDLEQLDFGYVLLDKRSKRFLCADFSMVDPLADGRPHVFVFGSEVKAETTARRDRDWETLAALIQQDISEIE